MRNTEIYFIDPKGNKIPNKEKDKDDENNKERNTHDNIATEYVFKENPELKKEFLETGISSPSVFLIFKGYLLVIQDDNNRYLSIDYSSLSLNEVTKLSIKRLQGFYKDYLKYRVDLHDYIMNDLSVEILERIRQLIRQRKKEGATREQMVEEITKTIVIPDYLAQLKKKQKKAYH